MKKMLLAFALLSCVAAGAANTPPKVVFIGDWITYNWTTGFSSNWINKGTPGLVVGSEGTSSGVLARFQSDVVSLHPQIVHIMIGVDDAIVAGDSSYQFVIPGFLSNLDAIVHAAKAANIKVILGIEPQILANGYDLVPQIDSVIARYGNQNDIPVINYGNLLCSCVGSATQTESIGNDAFNLYGGGPYLSVPPDPQPFPDNYQYVVTSTGYTAMAQMAQNAIATINLKLKGGWLQDIEQYNPNEVTTPPPTGPTNVNTVSPGAVLQFTPVGLYSDGSTHTLLNTNLRGASGTWTSSDPLVMYVSESGVAWANSPGKSIIRFTSHDGVKFSEWIMYVNAPAP